MVAEVETARRHLDRDSVRGDVGGDADRPDHQRATAPTSMMHYRAADYRPVQPARIPVLASTRPSPQGWPRRVLALGQRRTAGSWRSPRSTATRPCEWMTHGDCFISPGVRCRTRNGHARTSSSITSALCEATARDGARPVTWVATTFEERARGSTRCRSTGCSARPPRRDGSAAARAGCPSWGIPASGSGDELPPLFRDAVRQVRTTSSPFDEKVGAAVRAGADPWGAMWRAGGQSGAMLWDGPDGVTYGIH